jgi:hypothetical protein
LFNSNRTSKLPLQTIIEPLFDFLFELNNGSMIVCSGSFDVLFELNNGSMIVCSGSFDALFELNNGSLIV